MSPRVLIAAPVRDRAWILPDYLKALSNLDYPKDRISFYFLVNDCTDETEKILDDFHRRHRGKYEEIIIDVQNYGADPDRRDLQRRKRYNHFARLRNAILSHARAQAPDYLFSVDSDILLPSRTLSRLVDHEFDIVAGLIFNDRTHWRPRSERFCNVLMESDVHPGMYHHMKPAPSSLHLVDATGAMVLMSRKTYSCTQYGFHPQGEDIAWSRSAYEAGLAIFCDGSIPGVHVMDPEDLDRSRKELDFLEQSGGRS